MQTRLVGVLAFANGRREPLVLLVDTGTTHVGLLPERILELGLPLIGRQRLGSAEFSVYALDRLRISDPANGQAIERSGLVVVNVERVRLLRVDGVLGMNFFDGDLRVCLDLGTPALEVHTDAG